MNKDHLLMNKDHLLVDKDHQLMAYLLFIQP
jgi:hypothetical protein